MKEVNANQDFIVTARKWRPLRFDSVIGQEHITGTLKNAIKTGRIHHAYLFCGPRGVGKTTTARIMARAVNCLSPIDFEPCNECENCTAVLSGRSIDIIEIDGASNNSVDDIRKLRENAKYAPSHGKYKMYIIDEVHMLSTSAFNALLKILEEPPPHLLFVFATTESHKVPATIISRCQRFDFRRMEISDIVGQLKFIAEKENITIDEESLVTIAKKGDGSMRDSQSIFDQVVAFCGTDIKYTEMASALHLIDEEFFFRVTDAISEKDTAKIFAIAQEVISRGYEIHETLQGLLEHFRNILTVIVTKETKLINTSAAFLDKYIETAKSFTKADILRYIQIISSTEQAIKYLPQPRIRFELALISMAEMDRALEIKELIEEIRSIKSAAVMPSIAPTIEKKNIDVSNKPIKAAEKVEHSSVASKTNIPTASDIKKHWGEIVANCISKEPTLTFLQTIDTSFFDNEILLKGSNGFVMEGIKLKIDCIKSAADELLHSNIKISIAITDDEQSAPSNEPANKESDNYSSISSDAYQPDEKIEIDDESKFADKHPVEIKIMQLFNAIESK